MRRTSRFVSVFDPCSSVFFSVLQWRPGLSCGQRRAREQHRKILNACKTSRRSRSGRLDQLATLAAVPRTLLRNQGSVDAFAAALRAAGGRVRRRRALRMRRTRRFVSVFNPGSSVFFCGFPQFVVSQEEKHRRTVNAGGRHHDFRKRKACPVPDPWPRAEKRTKERLR